MAIKNRKIESKNVLLVEDLKPNILSVSQTCDQGYEVKAKENLVCRLKKRLY